MVWLFTAAIFTSATLLFLVQPLAAKLLLPLLGGTPQVWNTCMVFFQGVLLVGYLYTHILTTRCPARWQAAIHLGVLALAAAALPIALPANLEVPLGDAPILWILGVLGVMVGLPFFAVATMGPLLQRWFSRTDHPRASDPYFLYAASNLGSAFGLLAYPFLLQRVFTLADQGRAWAAGYGILAILVVFCGFVMFRQDRRPATSPHSAPDQAASPPPATPPAAPAATPPATSPPPASEALPVTWARRGRWILLSLIPSSLCMGATLHITTDVAAVPMLWVMPLLLYLLSMTLAFSASTPVKGSTLARVVPWLAILVIAGGTGLLQHSMALAVPAHLGFLFVAAWMCHRLLAEDRPGPARLTEFYLLMSVGGVLGGIFNGLIAPVAFDRVIEYPIAIAAALLVVPAAWARAGSRDHWILALAAAVVMAAVVLTLPAILPSGAPRWASGAIIAGICLAAWAFRGSLRLALAAPTAALALMYAAPAGSVLHTERTYFGVHQVINTDPSGRWRGLKHGTTLHGIQATFEPNRFVPTSYFHPTGPIGQVFSIVQTRTAPANVAVLGLGAGVMAAYARPGDTMLFFEIDPAVIRIADNPNYFTYVKDYVAKGARIGYVQGDGRLTIAASPQGPFDLIVMDAFTSDAVPVHLITQQAFKDVYLPQLRPGGIIAVNISNRHIDLVPPLAAVARSLGLAAYAVNDLAGPEEVKQGKKSSRWAVFARSASDLEAIATGDRWTAMQAPPDQAVWTDDFSDILSAYRWRYILGR